MSSLYQRARPVTFAEVVGQEHVKDVLASAVQRGVTGHAYMFSGPRGVGKTTTARLLAMAVNCDDEDVTARPCGVCESCMLVQSGSHPDVAELDAASNNSVDDVRSLRERVGLASLRGGTRVWILDEAHMLSKPAANALLKTLEEPPPGLLFVLATTEPEKLPATILSRCQHFRFRRLTDVEIQGKLERLCAEAGVKAEEKALALVARAADGGMRDAESLLDRLLVTGETITAAAAEDALGLPPQDRLYAMSDALVSADLAGLLEQAGVLYRSGYAPRTIAEQLTRVLRDRLQELLGTGGAAKKSTSKRDDMLRLIHALDDEHDRFSRRNDLYSLEVALIKAGNAVRFASAGVAGAQLAQRAVAGEPANAVQQAVPQPVSQAPREAVAQAVAQAPTQAVPQTAAPLAAPTAPGAAGGPSGARTGPAQSSTEPETGSPPEHTKPFSWHTIKSAAGPQLKAFLQPAQGSNDGHALRLDYEDRYKFHYEQLLKRR
ncbi:MAG TPA: DNA polymerase III subunit gamma/tau, partial [Trueperaceae bacterium]|nr:DNA polymerase III subunit gamma/tau [Trueperaceae bacterium]